MDIKALKVELSRQHPDSKDSLRCCALMIFKYFKDPITKEEISKKLHVYQKHSGLDGAYVDDLGRLALSKGYKTIIQHNNWRWWNESAVEASRKGKKELVKVLTSLKQAKKSWADKKVVKKEIEYVKLGGKYRFQVPKLSDLEYYLLRRIPVVVNVFAADLYHSPKRRGRYFILVVGKKDDKYIIRDPGFGMEKIPEDELLFAWSRAGGWMMVIEPREKKPEVKQEKLKF